MPGFSGETVDKLDGPRWELALTLIENGEAPVLLDEVEIRRGFAGPNADGVIFMSVTVGEHANRDVGLDALGRGRESVNNAVSADPRFAELVDKYGCRWAVVHDYGMGKILLREADRH